MHLQTNECGISDHLKGCNHHHLTKKHLFYKDQLLSSNVYILIFSINFTISCLWSTIIVMVDFGLIVFAPLSEWKWSYRTSNRARLDLNKRCAAPLPTSGGLQQRWRQSCSDEDSKVGNSVINDCDTHFAKTLIFSVCSHFKFAQ